MASSIRTTRLRTKSPMSHAAMLALLKVRALDKRKTLG
jgi:hypothetical protein